MKPPPDLQAQYDSPLVSIQGASMILGISVTEVRGRSFDGIYPYIVGPGGRLWYEEQKLFDMNRGEIPKASRELGITRREEIEATKLIKKIAASPIPRIGPGGKAEYTAEDASVVFAALAEGKTAIAIVQELQVHPLQVQAIAEIYHQMAGAILLSQSHVHALEETPISGPRPIKSAEGLLSFVLGGCKAAACASCKHGSAKFCAACLRGHVERAAQEILAGFTGNAPAPAPSPAPPVDPAGEGAEGQKPARRGRPGGRGQSDGVGEPRDGAT